MSQIVCLKGLFGKSRRALQYEIRKLIAEKKGMAEMTKEIARDREDCLELIDSLNGQIAELQRKLHHSESLVSVARLKVADLQRRNKELRDRLNSYELIYERAEPTAEEEKDDASAMP